MTDPLVDSRDWPLRAALLALAGAVVGLAVHHLLKGAQPWQWTQDPGRIALAGLLTTAGLAYAFVVERGRQHLSLTFAGIAALVVASVIYWNGPGSGWDAAEQWRLTCALLTVAIAAPLFQAWRDGGAGRTIPYVAAHDRAWTNVVLWFAAWAFVGVTWLLVLLLSELFGLIGLKFLIELLREDWFDKVLSGGALGGAIGMLRDRERILGTLQRVVTTVLAVLAPVLAVGLLAFLVALPITGLSPLWAATRATTPILLGCVIGALILANAVIGDSPADERRGVLRWSAMGLGVAMLPLGIITSVSTGLRIDQYGLTPERLWAVVFAGIACTYGLAYLVALVRARGGWAVPVRVANLRLGLALCALAFVLSTPMLSFNAIATSDQLARLADGRTPAAKFDWAALRFDFGNPGRAAVRDLARTGNTPAIRTAAAAAQKFNDRWNARAELERPSRAAALATRITVLPRAVPLPPALLERLTELYLCGEKGECAVLYTPGNDEAFAVLSADLGRTTRLTRGNGDWRGAAVTISAAAVTDAEQDARSTANERRADAIRAGKVNIREVRKRQVFIGDEPVGQPFD